MIAGLGLLFLIAGIAALIPAFIGMMRDWSDSFVTTSMSVVIIGTMGGCVLMLIGLAFFGEAKPSVVVGHCYEAVRTGSYIPVTISTGKSVVIVPTYVEGIDLVEVRCVG